MSEKDLLVPTVQDLLLPWELEIFLKKNIYKVIPR